MVTMTALKNRWRMLAITIGVVLLTVAQLPQHASARNVVTIRYEEVIVPCEEFPNDPGWVEYFTGCPHEPKVTPSASETLWLYRGDVIVLLNAKASGSIKARFKGPIGYSWGDWFPLAAGEKRYLYLNAGGYYQYEVDGLGDNNIVGTIYAK